MEIITPLLKNTQLIPSEKTAEIRLKALELQEKMLLRENYYADQRLAKLLNDPEMTWKSEEKKE